MGDIRDFYKQGRTCCLSIPLFQGGMMIILYLNVFLCLFAACMACFGPKILALVQPAPVSYAFAAVYLITASVQIYGKNLNLYAMGGLLSTSLVFIILSAAQHTTSITQCMRVYQFPVDTSFHKKHASDAGSKDPRVAGTSSAVHAAMTVCDVFSWIQVVVMALVWAALAFTQVYFGAKHRVYYELKEPDYLEDAANAPRT